MHDQPEPTEREDELAATERHREEDAKTGAGHDDPQREYRQEEDDEEE
jgi:hypothetical protein